MLPTLLLASLLTAAPATDLTASLRDLLGVAYVDDATVDETGRYTLFNHPEKTVDPPGLNCSGFVVAASQRLLGKKLAPAETARDRLGDSGDDSPKGKDWDFGWDLVMNLSDGLPRRALLPTGVQEVEGQSGSTMRGFSTDDAAAWKKILPRVRQDRVYLASLSRVTRHLEHHHVGVVLRDAADRVWFYQTLPKGHSHRLELSSPEGFKRMQGMFGKGIWILLLEVEPP
jgi:hypothetical protein